MAAIADPELPATLAELGQLRGVRVGPDGAVDVTLAPTGEDPTLLAELRRRVVDRLTAAGWPQARVAVTAGWSSDHITAEGRRRLAAAGIALPPPLEQARPPVELTLAVGCPRCGSEDTQEIIPEASAACCSLYVCRSCSEPFEFLRPV